MAPQTTRAVGCLLLALVIVVAAGIGGFLFLRRRAALCRNG
jgi:uncharacterized protein HemX